ncbi:MAG: hypothetical protein M1292_06935 [Bacteroidetes bacterium]|nr:hypothetical protein [Bacteroidota bacterium]
MKQKIQTQYHATSLLPGDAVTTPDGRTGKISRVNGRDQVFVALDENEGQEVNPTLYNPSEVTKIISPVKQFHIDEVDNFIANFQHESGNLIKVKTQKGAERYVIKGDLNDPGDMIFLKDPNNPSEPPTIVPPDGINIIEDIPSDQYRQSQIADFDAQSADVVEELNRRMQERIESSEHKPVIGPDEQQLKRRRLKSKIISWIIVCGIIVLILYTCSRCDLPPSKNPAPVKTETQKSEDKEKRRRLMRGEYDDIFGLLAIKYDVGIDTVDYISTEYLRIFNPGEYFIITIDDPQRDTTVFSNTYKPKQTVSKTINYLSGKYHLEKSKVASIIFDFRLYFKK